MAKTTQKDRVLGYINEFGSITTWQAYADLGITRLAAKIFELKRDGYIFSTEVIKNTNRYGEPCHYFKYRLVGELNNGLFNSEVATT